VHVRGATERHEVPCGRCTQCRIARAREWAIRCVHEAWACGGRAGFSTLTYRDEDLPAYASLDPDEFTKFWKRLRKTAGGPLRYYACGEYGETTSRPHYHVIVFGLGACSCDVLAWRRGVLNPAVDCGCAARSAIMRAWGRGGVDRVGSVTYDSARYTADYIGKSYLGRGAGAFYFPRKAPFCVMSQGLGRRFCDENAAQLRTNLSVSCHGSLVGLPRYYAKRLEVSCVREYDSEGVPLHRRVFSEGSAPLEVAEQRSQFEANLLARQHSWKRRDVQK